MINQEIIKIAKKYLGQHEKPANSGFLDSTFEKKMISVGWQKSQAWCCYFAELVWKEAYLEYNPKIYGLLDTLFASSATATYQRFDVDPVWNVSKVPVLGALAIWRHGVSWEGHVGIVSEIMNPVIFKSIEGNTDGQRGREGIEVAEKSRHVDYTVSPDKLNLIGFVIPNI